MVRIACNPQSTEENSEFSGNGHDCSLLANIGFTQWSGDGKSVYFDTGSSTDPAICRVRLADHKLERVASLKDFRRVVTPWISWSGLTPDGSPLLMRDIGTQEVYALDFEAP